MKRSEIENKYLWDIEDIYSSLDEYFKAYNLVKENIDFDKYYGKLNNVDTIKECLDKLEDVKGDIEKLAVYAYMKMSEDGGDRTAMELNDNINNLSMTFAMKTSFIETELAKLSDEKILEFKNSEKLKDYDRLFIKLLANKPHILSEEVEKVLSMTGKIAGSFGEIFSIVDNVDFDFPEIDINGNKTKITHGVYSQCLYSSDRNVREKAYKAYYNTYRKSLNTITALYKGNVDSDIFYSRVRKYNTCLEAELFNNEVDINVYNTLLKSIKENQKYMHDYVATRKQILGYDTLNMYDLYVPLVDNYNLEYDFEDAFELVKKGLAPLGQDYSKLLQMAHDQRWMDVYENDGKRSGAYSICVHKMNHPYVMLNHTKTTNSIFTMAHELGHSMHSYKSKNGQPISKSDYKIFVAEVASTVNEVLLLKYLINNVKDVKGKEYFLTYYMDMIRTTIFRQTMFAEFESKAHEMAENEIPLTKESLTEVYANLNKDYYGPAVVTDDDISIEWCRIPHFYRSFYVYQYATGLISAITIAERILSEGQKAVDDYFKFLSSGCSDTPVELLKIAGVDLTTDKPYNFAMNSFKNSLEELKKLRGIK